MNHHRLARYRPYVLLLPAILFYLIFWLQPVVLVFRNSLLDVGGGLTLAHYRQLLLSDLFWRALLNTVIFATVSLLIQTTLALGLALLANRRTWLSGTVLFVVLVPMALPPLGVSTLWLSGLTTHGWLNGLLMEIGWEQPIPFLEASGLKGVLLLVLIDSWTVIPSMVLILLAGLQGISSETIEAGYSFGAGKFRTFLEITLPQLKGPLVTAVILRLVAAAQIWVIAVVIFGYGRIPFLVERVAYYIEAAPNLANSQSLAAAYSLMVLVLVLSMVSIYFRLTHKRNEPVV